MRKDRTPYLVDGETDPEYGFLSLIKLTGQGIKDIEGYPNEYGTFTMTTVILEDGTEFSAEGSHDNPYLYASSYSNSAKFLVDLEDLYGDEDDE